MSGLGSRIPILTLAFVASTATGHAQPLPFVWKAATQSPQPTFAIDPLNTKLQALCGPADSALLDVAQRNLTQQLQGGDLLASDELVFALRAVGNPQPWPRAWSITFNALSDNELEQRVQNWMGGWKTLGERRCGTIRGEKGDGSTILSMVGVDVLADIKPFPTTARLGQWLTFEGTMRVPASAVKVVLLGPQGAPKSVLASLSQGKIRSSFALDQPGRWLVQALATVSTGPRPVLETMVFVGTSPPSQFSRAYAAGEDAGKGAANEADAMTSMMNAARASERLKPLSRDARLDALARQHSEAMIKARMVGHDVGLGDPAVRIVAAGIRAKITGENVASSDTVQNAHRAIWASPSHRGNLLTDRYSKTGVAVVQDDKGRVWVTQLFVGH